MARMPSTRVILLTVSLAYPAMTAAQTPPPSSPTPLASRVFDWSSLEVVKIPNGERRQVFDGPATYYVINYVTPKTPTR